MQKLTSLDVCDYAGNILCNLYDSVNDLVGQATDVFVRTERNGFKELRFKLPSVCEDERNYRLDYLISDYRIRFRTDKGGNVETDWFLISESKVTHSAFSTNYEIKASHISKLLNTKNLNLEFSDTEGNNVGTIGEIAAAILEGTGWHLNYVATFYEEDKYSRGEQVEKVRSFNASTKTGAFKMMSSLCEMFDAKPIYHGEGTYEEDGVIKIGRTVDIIPMNPFSEKLEEGMVPPDLNKEKILELYYDKNVKNITRTLNTDTLVTVFNAYGSYGDRNGMASLQTAEHAVITFGELAAGEYRFEYQQARYYFTVNEPVTGMKWSSLDPTSRSYLFDETTLTLIKTYKEPATNDYTILTEFDISYVKNQLPYLMDFTYYQKVGLLTDEMLYKIAQAQTVLPNKHVAAQEASIALSSIKEDLSQTASAGNGYLMLDVLSTNLDKGYVKITINKIAHKDGIIFRSDYDEAKRNRFSWNVATGIKLNGEAIAGQGAVVYIVHQGDPTKWVKSYVKCLGDGTDDYYRDSLGNIYRLHTESTYTDYDSFPATGEENIIYVAEDVNKTYAWFNDGYVEIKPSNYYYGLNEFEEPDTITLWCTEDTWQSGDKVYLFSSDSIAGVFGPREDAVYANRKSIEEATKISTEIHPVYFVTDAETVSSTACLDGYGWYYRSFTNSFEFGDLYFCWGKAGDLDWHQVYISNSDENPELIEYISGYNYYYSLKRMLLYKRDGNTYKAVNKTVDEEKITNSFTAVIEGCTNQEVLTKGMCETYYYSGEQDSLPIGNYAFKNEFDNYWLFSTDIAIQDTSLLRYIPSDKIVWQDNDEHHILKGIEHSFRYLDFPKENELYETVFGKGDYSNQTFSPDGNKYISGNVYVHENTQYETNLPSGSVVVCMLKTQVLGEYNTATFTTPKNTTHVRVVCPVQPDTEQYLRVAGYDKVLFCKNVKYDILSCTSNGERLGIYYLMDKFIELSHDAYLVKLPELQQAQKDITDINLELSETLGDMYREGFWQENNYVEGDEDKLYVDAFDNLKEISHPQARYDIVYLELHDSDDNLGATVKTEYPDVDITYAAHLVDMDIDTNRWAYIDVVDKCYDKPWATTIEINTRLSLIGQQSFTDVLAKIAEVANETKAKQTIYSKAEAIGGAGQFAAENLEGALLANKIYILGGTANWYTDSKGNIVLEDADGNSAMMLTGRGLLVSQERDVYGDWSWRTALTGKGFNADVISTGELSAKHIIAGTITSDKLASSVGQELDIASNKALNLYATVDGSRPVMGLETKHPNPTDSYIKIAAQDGDDPAYVDIQSGGLINVYGGSSVNVESGGLLNVRGGQINVTAQGKLTINAGTVLDIKSGGELLIDSDNFSIRKNSLTGQHDVTIVGNINATGGKIAGLTVGTSGQTTYMYADGKQSVTDTGPGMYIGTDGINIGGKFMFNTSGTLTKLILDADQTYIGDVTLNNSISKSFYKTKTEMLSNTTFKAGDTWQDSAASSYGLTYVCKRTWDTSYSSSTFNNYWSPVGSAAVAGAKLVVDAINGNISMVAANTVDIASGSNLNISSGTVNITTAGTLSIGNGAKPFTVGADGNGNAFIRNGVLSISDVSHDGVYLGTNGIALGKGKFIVLPDGSLTATSANITGTVTATSGKIANWFIKSSYIGNAETLQTSAVGCGSTSVAFWAGHNISSSGMTDSAFYVLNTGAMKATNATITGAVTATSGAVGDFVINSALYTSTKPTIDTDVNGVYIGSNGISLGKAGKFKVTNAGVLTATGVDVTGTIRASALYINSTKANLSLDSSGHITAGSLGTINLSATNFDSLGVSQTGKVYITPTSIQMGVASNGVVINNSGVSIKGSAALDFRVDSNNYVNISTDGIVMKGKKLWIYDSGNNKVETWGRDDIIVLKSNGETESQIISRQSGKTDWVLIKPYYNAEIKGIPNTGAIPITNTTTRSVYFIKQGGNTSAFGSASWYKYQISGKFRRSAQTGGSVEFRLANYELTSASDSPQVTVTGTIETGSSGTTTSFSFSTGNVSTNLCAESTTVYCYVWGLTNGTGTFSDVVITCTCSASASKVPCTVYYYP